jgi:thiamine biosynthesis lipoprotein
MLEVKTLTGGKTTFGHSAELMGSRFEIRVVSDEEALANQQVAAALDEIDRVGKLLSTVADDSRINEINRNAGVKPVKVNSEIFRLVERSLQISELTYGTFDITYPSEQTITSNTQPARRKAKVASYKNIVLDAAKQTVFLKNKGMCIGFDAISRGYAADRAKYILQMSGVSSGVINAGGDLLSWGLQPDNTPWTIGAADPSQAHQPFARLNISNMAIATSFNNDGVKTVAPNKIACSINPDTGFEVSKIKSVSIITPGAELADAMALPIIAMGINAGLYLINKLNQMACIIIDDHQRVYTSRAVNLA